MKIKTVYIEITNRCNLNCRTCYNRSGLNQTTQELSVEEIEQIINTLSRYGARRFLFSGGEPSLHSHFHELLELTSRYPQYSYGFVTNGTVADPIWIEYLNTQPNLTLQISLDGADEVQNSLIRGKGNFEKVVFFAKEIKNPNLTPRLKMVISQSNITEVEPFYRLALSLNCVPEYAFIYRSGNGSDEWESKALSTNQKIQVMKQIEDLNQKYQTDAFFPKCTVNCPFVIGTEELSLCIKTDGSIQPCQTLYSPEFTLANVLDFQEEIFFQNLEVIHSTAKKRATTDFGCNKCMLKSVCGRGCMAEAFLMTSDPLGNDQNCLFRKIQFLNFDLKRQQNS